MFTFRKVNGSAEKSRKVQNEPKFETNYKVSKQVRLKSTTVSP